MSCLKPGCDKDFTRSRLYSGKVSLTMAEPAKYEMSDQPESGFRANLSGASLADLVQFECLAQTGGVFRITSRHEVGYLFFRAGQVVHAVSGDATGLSAALEILNWRQGTFEPCRVAWPDVETIETSWQSLLISAAQAQDESGQRFMSVGREFPESGVPRPQVSASAPPTPLPAARHGVVQLDPSGHLVQARGGATEELVELAAYSVRLADLLGEALGMDRLTAFESTVGDGRYLIQVDASGSIMAVRSALDADLAALRERAGL